MSLYDRVAAMPHGGRALAVVRLRRAVITALHTAFRTSPLQSQTELAKRLKVRRSAVNQVFRGDGNVRVSTLAEYLYEMGYELDITLVKAGELRAAALEDRTPIPAFASSSASTSLTYGSNLTSGSELGGVWSNALVGPEMSAFWDSGALYRYQLTVTNPLSVPVLSFTCRLSSPGIWISNVSAVAAFESINLSSVSIGPGAES